MFRTQFVILLLVLAVGCRGGFAGDRKFDQSFSVSSGGKLVVNTDAGSVAIEGTSGSEVIVHADMHGRDRDIRDFEINASKTDEGVEVRGRSSRSVSSFWRSGDLDIRYTIKVPREYSLSLNTSGGDISVKAVKGRIEGNTSGGDLKLSDLEGTVNIGTSGGEIQARNISGDLQAETSGGDIRISGVRGSVDVSTSGGNIALGEIDGKVKAETSGGDVTVHVQNSHQGIMAETSGGDINITVPPNIAATIDASTSGGSVTTDLPITISGKIDESRIRGTVNGGGNTIYAHTSGGDVRIKTSK
jgi:Toastrack DUF4097